MSIPLSLVIITHNEEDNIARCLRSAQSIADEIVVVDSYSNDQTQAICERYQVRFIQHPFEGFMQQKNYAVAQATHPYILSLDADEVLSPTLLASIQTTKKKWTHDAYAMNRLNNYCGKWIRHCGWYPDTKVRLFDRRKASWGAGEIHEKIVLDANSNSSKLEGDLLHYSYTSISGHVRRINSYTDRMAKATFQRGKRSNIPKILFSPIFNFIKKYIFKLGFLDGYYGLVVCIMAAYYSFLKYAKLYELQQKQKDSIKNL